MGGKCRVYIDGKERMGWKPMRRTAKMAVLRRDSAWLNTYGLEAHETHGQDGRATKETPADGGNVGGFRATASTIQKPHALKSSQTRANGVWKWRLCGFGYFVILFLWRFSRLIWAGAVYGLSAS
jgi:hypothetical protein